MTCSVTHENFTISFKGPSLDSHEMPVDVLANSLLAMRYLSKKAVKAIHGKDADCDMKVVGGFKPGSFCVDLVMNYAAPIIGAYPTVISTVVSTIQGLIWLKNNPFTRAEKVDASNTMITSFGGDKQTFNNCTINLFSAKSIRHDADVLTAPLDYKGVDEIEISSSSEEFRAIQITPQCREYVHTENEVIVSDDVNEVEVFITASSQTGYSKYWRFSDDGEIDYSALIEDTDFLNAVKNGDYSITNGDKVVVDMQTIRTKKARRIITDRIILKVKEFIPATKSAQ